MRMDAIKPVVWVGSSKEDLKSLPSAVQDAFGYAIYLAQTGKKHPDAKPLQGFGGASVLEVVEDYRGDAYRAVYTVRFAEAVYVLHVFQKKAPARHRHTKARPRFDQGTTQACTGVSRNAKEVML